jgi:hypothetical protein
MIGHNHLGKNGRFGNQMFQYAATRGIAAKHGYDFCIPAGPDNDSQFYDEENQHKLFMAFKMPGCKVINDLPAPYRQESTFTFDEDLFENCEDNVNLYGYFQSEKYFKHIEKEIREDFEWRGDALDMCQNIFKNIAPEGKAISLHVRRTDHLIKPTYHAVLPMSYYEEALSHFDSDLPVLVFSDDPQWCAQQSIFSSDRFLISEGGDNITDMCMMSLCSHSIMANSTFSWWGAWLAGHDNVIGPTMWFGPDGQDPKDVFVDRWKYLEVDFTDCPSTVEEAKEVGVVRQ